MAASSEIGIVGAGIVGLSAAYALTQRGVSVTVYERGVPGNGQSGGDSRIFRHSHDDPRLIDFARLSLTKWREWERQSGAELVSRDGVVALGPNVPERHAALAAHGVDARLIESSELYSALPLVAASDDRSPMLLDRDGGVIRTRAAIRMLREAIEQRLVFDDVMSVRPTAHATVEVRRGDATAEHAAVLVCAGVGTAPLAHGVGIEPPVRTSLHARVAFAVAAAPPARLACILDSRGVGDEPSAYGDPLPGNDAYAVGVTEVAVHPDGGLIDPAGLAEAARRAVEYVRAALPGLDPDPVQVRHCWVTELWAHDAFAVWSADHAHFLVGHNLFKHAPALGEALAAKLLGENPGIDLSPAARLGERSGDRL